MGGKGNKNLLRYTLSHIEVGAGCMITGGFGIIVGNSTLALDKSSVENMMWIQKLMNADIDQPE